MMRWSVLASMALAAALLVGCRQHNEHGQAPPAPHNGEWLETGDSQVRIELVHQPRDSRIIIYFMDSGFTPLPTITEPPTLTLLVSDQRLELTMQPLEDTPAAYQATHDAFKGEDFRGLLNYTLSDIPHAVEIGGESHGHAHAH